MNTTAAPARSLHGYFRSSASYRVRIALNLKGLAAEHIGVHLVRGGGEQHGPEFRRINPQGQVPVLTEDGFGLTQSLAIIEYLEERWPGVPLLPADLQARARVRQFALSIACDIHPLNNPRVLKYVAGEFGADDPARVAWIRHWIDAGFGALESQLQAESNADPGAPFCVGAQPTLADCCLVPQVFNANRFGVEMTRYPRIQAITAACEALPAFRAAHPARQPDAE